MTTATNSKKRSFEEVDQSPPTSTKVLRLDLPLPTPVSQPSPQPRILPFRASPTSKHTLSFAQCSRSRPTTLISANGTLTPESSEDEGQPRCYFLPKPADLNLQTPPRTKSSTKSNFDAFSNIRDTTDNDTDMADSPAPSSYAWSSPASTPSSPPAKSFYAQAATPPSPSSSRMALATPPPPRSSRFRLQPPPRRDQIIGGRIPTPTYGHFRLTNHSDDEISPKTRQKGSSFLRRGPCPPSPISEDEFESPCAIAGGMFDALNIGSPSVTKKRRHIMTPVMERLERTSAGRAGIDGTSAIFGHRAMGSTGELGELVG